MNNSQIIKKIWADFSLREASVYPRIHPAWHAWPSPTGTLYSSRMNYAIGIDYSDAQRIFDDECIRVIVGRERFDDRSVGEWAVGDYHYA